MLARSKNRVDRDPKLICLEFSNATYLESGQAKKNEKPESQISKKGTAKNAAAGKVELFNQMYMTFWPVSFLSNLI